MAFSKDLSNAIKSFVKADLARKQSAMTLAELISCEINSDGSLTEWRNAICSLSEQVGNKAYKQAYRYPERLAAEKFGWENPSQKHKASKEGDARKRKLPVVKTVGEKTPIESLLRQALSKACLELSDSELLSLISKENRVKSTIPVEVRAKFNKHLIRVLNGK